VACRQNQKNQVGVELALALAARASWTQKEPHLKPLNLR
jgi:hypothetical protein